MVISEKQEETTTTIKLYVPETKRRYKKTTTRGGEREEDLACKLWNARVFLAPVDVVHHGFLLALGLLELPRTLSHAPHAQNVLRDPWETRKKRGRLRLATQKKAIYLQLTNSCKTPNSLHSCLSFLTYNTHVNTKQKEGQKQKESREEEEETCL